MNKPNKFIKTLSETEYKQLLENYQKSNNRRVRQRAHAILLSFQGYSVDEIAEICQAHRTTVGIWLDNWIKAGTGGLVDGERSGRPSILTVEEQVQARETALKRAKFPARQLGEIKEKRGKEISSFTLKRLLKKKTICGKESS
jgi:transposase